MENRVFTEQRTTYTKNVFFEQSEPVGLFGLLIMNARVFEVMKRLKKYCRKYA